MYKKVSDNEVMYMNGQYYKTHNFDKVIISVGSCENHGNHLPYGTDSLVSYKLAVDVADNVKGMLVLPPITFGFSDHYSEFKLNISIQSETLIEVLKDVLTSVYKNGIKHVFIMNGHDGNIAPIEVASRAIKLKYPDMKIASLDAWWVAAGNLLPKNTFDVWDGLGHAGEGETSISLAMHPEWCDMEHAAGVVPDHLIPNIDIKWNFAELTNTGATGDPTVATAEKGEKMRKVLVDLVVDFIEKMDSCNWSYESTKALWKK